MRLMPCTALAFVQLALFCSCFPTSSTPSNLSQSLQRADLWCTSSSVQAESLCPTCCRYTNKGRAFNPFAPTIGDSLNTAFISAVYATIESTQISSSLQFRLNCWSRSQVRYVLGDAGRSLVSGWGHKAPNHVQVLPVYLLQIFSCCVGSLYGQVCFC